MSTDPFTRRFAKALRDTRVNFARMTQEELAKKSGLSNMHISHFECGRRLPSLKNYAALVKALDTTTALGKARGKRLLYKNM